ncbi:oligosaccharide flippase family protein [Sedimentimonas flavescens]|uniref:Oligosaccharide flippase family protein n=1 Tax=Sedimentimonas flavescens TaxID=2851012 RepID=A0ABT2ZVU1_9RHOB|nr:oligosaccharide flippase family protein [Sedimentimonas flavescens]MCV2877856.1 oligosaccharide flippase family protein [Sedimentimonas flavescens]
MMAALRRPAPWAGLLRQTREARWTLIGQVVASGGNFATSVLLVRAMGLEGFGRYSLCFIALMILRNLLGAVLLTPLALIGPRLRNTSLTAFRGLARALALCLGAVGSLTLFAGFALLAQADGYAWAAPAALPLALANLLGTLADFLRRHLLVFERARAASAQDVLRHATQIGAIAVLILSASEMTEIEALWALCLGSSASVAFGLALFGRATLRPRFARSLGPKLWDLARWQLPTTLLETLQGNAPLLIAGFILGDGALGLLRALQQVTNLLALPFNALSQIAPSIAARSHARLGVHGLRRALLRLSLGTVGLFALAMAALLALWPVLSARWMQIDVPRGSAELLLYCLLNLIVLLRLPLTSWTLALGRPQVITRATAFGTVCSIGVTLALLAPLGAVAAVLGQIAGALGAMIGTALAAPKREAAS